MTELEDMRERGQQVSAQLRNFYMWSLKQSADLRAKAELMEEVDEEIEVYGETDPARVLEVARKLEEISQEIRL